MEPNSWHNIIISRDVLISDDVNENWDGFKKFHPNRPYPLIMIEIQSRGKKLLNHLHKILKQLRLNCIQHGLKEIYGVLTNLKEWYFIKYDLEKESL